MSIGAPLDPREFGYRAEYFEIPDDGDPYSIRCDGWMVHRIQVYTVPPAVGSFQLGDGSLPIPIGSADAAGCLILEPNYLHRLPIFAVTHNSATGGTFQLIVEFAFPMNPTGLPAIIHVDGPP